ncbi:MAG: hypothetical protein ABIA75_08915 [Candidatus Neomarinimicrobiota bacterium]
MFEPNRSTGRLAGILLVILIVGACDKNSDDPAGTFSKTFGFEYQDEGAAVQQTAAGGYIIVGTTNSYQTLADVWLLKTDRYGEEEWSQVFGGSGFDRGLALDQTADGGFIIGGYTESSGAGLKDAWIIKTDSRGNRQWDKIYGAANDDICYDIKQTGDGGYIICGTTTQAGQGLSDIWLIRTDPGGERQWNQTYGYSGSADQGYAVLETLTGDFVVVGYTSPGDFGFSDLRLLRTDNQGAIIWDIIYGGDDYDEGYSVCETSDGGWVLAGSAESYGNGLDDIWLIKLDADGEIAWERVFGGDGRDLARSVVETFDGGFIVVGATNSFNTGDYDVWVVKTDSSGSQLWNKSYGGELDDGGNSICRTADGGYIITGYTNSAGNGGDLWLLKIDSQGNY